MKIKKNLPDEQMLKNSGEFFGKQESKLVVVQNKSILKTIALSEDVLMRVDKEAFNLRIKLKQKGIDDIQWKVTTDNDKIILKPIVKDKK